MLLPDKSQKKRITVKTGSTLRPVVGYRLGKIAGCIPLAGHAPTPLRTTRIRIPERFFSPVNSILLRLIKIITQNVGGVNKS